MKPPIDRLQIAAEIKSLNLAPEEEYICPYLGRPDVPGGGQRARNLCFAVSALPPGYYHALLDLGFRRSGLLLYRPVCRTCSACRQIRVPVQRFKMSRSQKRCFKKNSDVEVKIGELRPTPEKFALYQKYIADRHGREAIESPDSFLDFLYDSPVITQEIEYRLHGTLAGVGIFDAEPEAMSAVYCYYDPDLAERSLGTFNVLSLLHHARQVGTPFVYLGYYIRECANMNYKANFRPAEVLVGDGVWEEFF